MKNWKTLDLEIAVFEYHHDPTNSCELIPSRTLNLKHLEIIKVSGKPTYDT